MKSIKVTLGTGLLTAISLYSNAANNSSKPNIIFILCDDMGYGDLGCYGQKYIQTPNLDRMAQEGMLFTQAYAGSPVSAPSRASLMTGLIVLYLAFILLSKSLVFDIIYS